MDMCAKGGVTESTECAINLWLHWMQSDYSEMRALWYPSKTPGLSGNWSRAVSDWEDFEDSLDARIITVVNTAVTNLSPALRCAFEVDVGLRAVWRVRDQEGMADEAKQRIQRALLADGLV